MINAAQIRGARGLLGISQKELAELAFVSAATVKRVETGTQIRGSAETFRRLQTALEAAGIEFLAAGSSRGPGVCLSKDVNLLNHPNPSAH